jgi:tRNA G18 (ribose-2'-O)-methylase SpoU
MPVIEVDNFEDPRLDDYRNIRDRDLRRDGALFVGEQALVVQRMLGRPGVTRSVLIASNWMDRIAPLAAPEVPVYVTDPPTMKKVAGFDIHRGVLAMGYRRAIERSGLPDDLLARDPLTLLVCEDIANIDNIGMLFRNAAAFGVDGVLLSPSCHDPLYRKSLRVSIGHALDIPFARSRDWAGDLADLARRGITLIAAAATGSAVAIDEVPPPRRVALVVGQEFDGVSAATLDACHHVVRIPMTQGVDSLNVAVAAAVCLHRFSTAARV